jgi:hypothetical protein
MSNFYGATGLIGGAAGDLDNIDGTSLAAGDGAVVITSTTAYLFYLNASSGAVESSPYVISPDANAGNKRWILLGVLTEDVLTELLKLLDTDKSHSLSLKWNEDDTANRILNIEVQGGDRTLVLHENLTIGNGEAGTITFSASGKTLTIAGSATINDWFDQSVKQAASPTFADATISGLTASKPVFTDASKKLVSTGTLAIDQGGTGAATLTDHGILLGSGTDPITPMTALGAGELVVGVAGADPHALSAGATTEILVGGGAADPVWTTATGTGAPVRANGPTTHDGLIRAQSSEAVADEAEITLATGVSGWGFAQAGDNEEWIQFSFSAAGVVTVIANSAHAVNTDTDGNLCVYDAGSGIAIKNRLGASKTIRYVVHYSS